MATDTKEDTMAFPIRTVTAAQCRVVAQPLPKTRLSWAERFWDRVDRSAGVSACWPWLGRRTRDGYGLVEDPHGHTRYAHRVMYGMRVSPIPDGMVIDHLCRMPHCVNPAHMEVVTSGENTRRGAGISARNAQKTMCPQGHPYDAENTLRYPNGSRKCLICKRTRERKQVQSC